MWEFIGYLLLLLGHILMWGGPIMFLMLALNSFVEFKENPSLFFQFIYGCVGMFISILWGTFTIYSYFIW